MSRCAVTLLLILCNKVTAHFCAWESPRRREIKRLKTRSKIQLESTPASSIEQLKSIGIEEVSRITQEKIGAIRANLVAKLPKRINVEPKAGEKRDATDLDGNCTNDLMVDLGEFAIQAVDVGASSMKLLPKITESKDRTALEEMKKLAVSLVDKCDEIVDRYGATAVCNKTDETKSEHRMADFREACAQVRVQFLPLL